MHQLKVETPYFKCPSVLDYFIKNIAVKSVPAHFWPLFQELSLTSTYLIRRMEPFFPFHDVRYRPILFL